MGRVPSSIWRVREWRGLIRLAYVSGTCKFRVPAFLVPPVFCFAVDGAVRPWISSPVPWRDLRTCVIVVGIRKPQDWHPGVLNQPGGSDA